MARRQRGFTIIEVLAVLVIAGLLAGAVIFRLWEPLRVATADDVCEQVLTLDRVARRRAGQVSGPVKLVYTAGTNEASRVEADALSSAWRLRLPGRWKFESVWVEGQSRGSGDVEVALSPDGYGPCYALELSGPQGARQWLIFAAMGGDLTRETDASTARAMLQSLEPHGVDAP